MKAVGFETRRASPSDADDIAAAHRDSIRSIGPSFYPPDVVEDWGARLTGDLYVRAMQQGEVFYIAVGAIDGAPAVLGFATHRVDETEHGTAVYVREAAARRGIGSALFRLAEADAVASGAAGIQVDASLAAVEFYKANGFEEVGRGEHRLPSGRPMACVFMRKTFKSRPDGKAIDEKRELLRHFLAALAYRTQKALRGAPPEFGAFSAADGVRTPIELVRHMTSVLGYARTFFVGGHYRPDPLPSLEQEVARFHDMLAELAQHLRRGTVLLDGMSAERLLQGPFSDAMTHAGQLAILRRLAGTPVAPENFIVAEIGADHLGPGQADPKSADESWPEAPPGWVPPSRR